SAIADGGCTVAADPTGNVCVAWHGQKKNGESGEQNRKVWVARSADDGKTFALETPAWTEATRACACCSMRAFAHQKGSIYLRYGAANERVTRGMYLLASTDRGKSFGGAPLDDWKIPT